MIEYLTAPINEYSINYKNIQRVRPVNIKRPECLNLRVREGIIQGQIRELLVNIKRGGGVEVQASREMLTLLIWYYTMPRPVISPISTISRLFIHITIFQLAYEFNATLGLYIRSLITDNTASCCQLLENPLNEPPQYGLASRESNLIPPSARYVNVAT